MSPIGKAKKTNTMLPNDRKVLAYYEAGRVLVGWLLEHTDALLKARNRKSALYCLVVLPNTLINHLMYKKKFDNLNDIKK